MPPKRPLHVAKTSRTAPHRLPAGKRARRMAQSLSSLDMDLRRLLEGVAAGATAVLARVYAGQSSPAPSIQQNALCHRLCGDAKRAAPSSSCSPRITTPWARRCAKDVTLDKLLSPDPRPSAISDCHGGSARAGLPYRMSEGNSCWNGGQQERERHAGQRTLGPDMMLTSLRSAVPA